MEPLILQAPAKVNLTLRITGRRPDGYHELHSLMQKIDLCDTVELHPVPEDRVNLSCPDSDLPTGGDNIAHRAARLFLDTLDSGTGGERGVHIVLHKKIPVAAGLGGGSSDAAAVLLGLKRLFAPRFPARDLAALGLRLGADVPFFLQPNPCCLATGIGEILSPARGLSDEVLVVVNPGFAVSTRWVYEKFSLTFSGEKRNLPDSRFRLDQEGANIGLRWPDLHNDLERVTAGAFSEISRIKDALLDCGAAGALMSGSGPTLFGVFGQECFRKAQSCADQLRKRYPLTWVTRPYGVSPESGLA